MEPAKNILICPLEWGLGHAGRMIPLAEALMKRGHNVIAASGREHLALFLKEIPGIATISFSGFKPSYSRSLPQWLALLGYLPAFVFHLLRDNVRLGRIVDQHRIDIVISDNRFGLWTRKARCVYFTHMLRIPMPRMLRFLEPLAGWTHRLVINRYDLCFIPDMPGKNNLSGDLSHGMKLPHHARYAGIISRFSGIAPSSGKKPEKPYITILLSGPEPQKSIFRNLVLDSLADDKRLIVIMEGKPEDKGEKTVVNSRVISYAHPERDVMRELLEGSSLIITRPGYTTLMDLSLLGLTALTVPTPGQTEQEYLASFLGQEGRFRSMRQKDLGKGKPLIEPVKTGDPFNMNDEGKLLQEAVSIILS